MDLNAVKDKKYNYIEVGEGTPIVILHGLMGGLSNFEGVAKHFSQKGYKIVIPELPLYTQNILKTNNLCIKTEILHNIFVKWVIDCKFFKV